VSLQVTLKSKVISNIGGEQEQIVEPSCAAPGVMMAANITARKHNDSLDKDGMPPLEIVLLLLTAAAAAALFHRFIFWLSRDCCSRLAPRSADAIVDPIPNFSSAALFGSIVIIVDFISLSITNRTCRGPAKFHRSLGLVPDSHYGALLC
jgi:hypothetical protein